MMSGTTTMAYCGAVLALAYVALAAWHRGAWPESVSALAYPCSCGEAQDTAAGEAQDTAAGRGGRTATHTTLWMVWVWAVAGLLMPRLLEVMPDEWAFVGFLTMGCLLFVGAMPLVTGERNTAHYVLAIAGGVLSQVCVLIIGPWWLAVWMLLLVAAMVSGLWTGRNAWIEKNGVLVMEGVCFTSLIGAMITG